MQSSPLRHGCFDGRSSRRSRSGPGPVPTGSMSGSRNASPWRELEATGEARKVADIAKARKLLGYDPKVGLREAMALTVDWFRKNRSAGRR